MKSKILFMLLLMIFTAFLYSCKKKENDNKANNNEPSNPDYYTTVTITHHGYDFSAGKSDTTAYPNNTNDGDVICWNPENNGCTNYQSYINYVWFRNSNLDTVNFKNATKDYGIVDITTITTIPAVWDTGCAILPLIPEHVIVAKCADGYVKFKVNSADTSSIWHAEVKYLFSNTNSFAH